MSSAIACASGASATGAGTVSSQRWPGLTLREGSFMVAPSTDNGPDEALPRGRAAPSVALGAALPALLPQVSQPLSHHGSAGAGAGAEPRLHRGLYERCPDLPRPLGFAAPRRACGPGRG